MLKLRSFHLKKNIFDLNSLKTINNCKNKSFCRTGNNLKILNIVSERSRHENLTRNEKKLNPIYMTFLTKTSIDSSLISVLINI